MSVGGLRSAQLGADIQFTEEVRGAPTHSKLLLPGSIGSCSRSYQCSHLNALPAGLPYLLETLGLDHKLGEYPNKSLAAASKANVGNSLSLIFHPCVNVWKRFLAYGRKNTQAID
ncbi:hypothetical protein PGTUg99_009388 [Puccinia graminis f. sp. tritici]|uniref:Uncharacterized protein n=1 Tax=Puccinia graminis f. sp. tritici TaxID=56615 RepID=A0A5B0M0Q5_PUCGR|nr:hypothetical protein PGTUg99_009388 [Puccinia graminis f. sp. tritici]